MTRLLYSLAGTDITRPFSPHCWKIILALRHKGLSFEEKPLAFTEIPTVEEGISKLVPILRDGDTVVADSFQIALYLEEAYPDRPSLFRGEGGKALARFVEGYSQSTIHPAISAIILMDIYNMISPADQAHFRKTREALFGKVLEEIFPDRDGAIAAFPAKLQPLRHMLRSQPFIGGEKPLFADYIVFGALQWLKIVTGSIFLPEDDPAAQWFERCAALGLAQADAA
ncbi:glutathione S-transferase family protein [Agrobacterium vitis]|uniref:glutathione S-transferase family protein n=1 Tax=Agrobacterium vitis TaxID=373 RepID=UPI0012E7E1EC|nr:glutathione S-transferase family protein [Agrobacterium vitis]MVA35148.1 glutathione S-transferase family protein [Agrobacterium vitis]